MDTQPRVLVLGGLDPTGGAGITADARALLCAGAQALPVAMVLTVQNRRGMQQVVPVEHALWRAALAAAVADGPVHAIKTGLLGDAAQVVALAELLGRVDAPLVVDPVFSATAGGFAVRDGAVVAVRERLLPMATVTTPNLPELEALGGDVGTLLRAGCRAVLVKGGHGDGDPVVDRLHEAGAVREFAHRRLPVGPVHGTGCALASHLAGGLARGEGIAAATAAAIAFVQRGLAAMGPPDADGLPRPLLHLPT